MLDSGNTLTSFAVSEIFFNKLKKLNVLPRGILPSKTNCSIRSADSSPLTVLGKVKLKSPITLKHPSAPFQIVMPNFYVIKHLSNSINIGRPILKRLSVIWDFTSPTVSIKGQDIRLESHIEDGNPGHINNIIIDNSSSTNYLYSSKTVFIPPKSSAIIQLKPSALSSSSLPDDVIITPDKKFESNKLVYSPPLTICNKNHLLTTVSNPHDSGVTIIRNQIVGNLSTQPPEFINNVNAFINKQGTEFGH